MADDLAAMKTRIASELRRSDLTTQIAAAIADAIKVYQKQRFRFSDQLPNAYPTVPTVAGQSVYTEADLAGIGTLFNIDGAFLTIGNQPYELTRAWDLNELFTYNQAGTMRGQPDSFGYEGNQLVLSPVPAAVYTITLRTFRQVAAPAGDGEAGNPWMIAAESLIRSRAKFELATHVTRNAEMAAAMSPDAPAPGQAPGATYRAWQELKQETNRVRSRGRIRPVQF